MKEQHAMPILNEQQRKVYTQVSTNKEDIASLRNEMAQLREVVNKELALIRELADTKANPGAMGSLAYMDKDIQALQNTMNAPPPTDTQLGLGNGAVSKVMPTGGAMDPAWAKSVEERIGEQGRLLEKLKKVYHDMHANLPLLSCRTSRIALRAVELSAEDRKLALEALTTKENKIRDDIDRTTDKSFSTNYGMASIADIVSPLPMARDSGGAYGYSAYSNPIMSPAGPQQGSRPGQPPPLASPGGNAGGYAMMAPRGTNLT